jgi:hypothetical protein
MDSLLQPQAIMYIVAISLAVMLAAKAWQRFQDKKTASRAARD